MEEHVAKAVTSLEKDHSAHVRQVLQVFGVKKVKGNTMI